MNARTKTSSPLSKLFEIYWLLPMLVFLIGLVGVAMIYSATNGIWGYGAKQHLMRFVGGMGLMFVVALTNIKVWYALAYPSYIAALILLVGVEFVGDEVNGSQRWLDLGLMRLQPSELMKMAVVLALARFYHDLPRWRVSEPSGIIGAILLIGLPVGFVLKQPDLGTSLLIAATGVTLIFLAGINWRIIITTGIATVVAIPLAYTYGLKDYQKARWKTFMNPDQDPTDAGYQIIQSKIALGSGGVNGKGFTQGTQASLKYVPENRTDFIFTVIGEEFGFMGGLGTIALYIMTLAVCFWLASQCKHIFSRLLIYGLATTFALYVIINLAMVMGLAPVVGVPLALISYGGSVMMTVLIGFGLILSAHLHRETELPRGSGLLL